MTDREVEITACQQDFLEDSPPSSDFLDSLSRSNMPNENVIEIAHFEYQAPWGWRACFFLVSLPFLLFSMFFWFHLLANWNVAHAWSIVLMFVFTAIPLFLGLWLLFFSLRGVRLSLRNEQLLCTLKLFWFSRTRVLEFDNAILELASFGHRNPRLWLAIYLCKNESRWMLANEQTCDSVRELFAWLEQHPHFDCRDASNDSFAG